MGKRGVKLESIDTPARFRSLKQVRSLEQALFEGTYSLDFADNASSHWAIVRKHVRSDLQELTYNPFILLDKIPIGIVLISQKTLETIYVNRICLDILDCTSLEEKLTLSWSKYLPPDSYQQFLKLITQPRVKQYYPSYYHLQIKRKDGNIRDVRISLSDLLKHEREYSLLFIEDITEQGKNEKDLQEDNEKRNLENLLEAFSYRIIEVQEDERRKISYELHDEIGQILTAVQLMLMRAPKISPKHKGPEHSESENLIKEAIAQVQRFSQDLNPTTLKTQGLLPALIEYFERYKIWSGVTVKFTHTGLEGRGFPDAINNTVYRIVQESLTNVARHACVKSVNVAIQVTRETLCVRIMDKGKGFNPKTLDIQKSGGLFGIHERLLLLRGKLEIDSAPGKGTCLTGEIPLSTNADKKGSKNDIDCTGR
jgi:PAS domain S-box-containing protein